MPDRRPVARSSVFLAAALAAAVGIAACGGAPSAPPATPVASGVIAIQATEYAFGPATITVPAGTIQFAVSNAGNEDHEFEILQGELALGRILAFGPRATRDLTVLLEPGTYAFVCRLNGHNQLGMTGTLTVN